MRPLMLVKQLFPDSITVDDTKKYTIRPFGWKDKQIFPPELNWLFYFIEITANDIYV